MLGELDEVPEPYQLSQISRWWISLYNSYDLLIGTSSVTNNDLAILAQLNIKTELLQPWLIWNTYTKYSVTPLVKLT